MNYIIYTIPFITATFGWIICQLFFKLLFHPIKPINFLGITLQGVLPSRKQEIAKSISSLAAENISLLLNAKDVNNLENLERLMPFIDKNVEHFLRIKLAEKMPMISMFIGDATIAELKAVFIEEIQILFPDLMKLYVEDLWGTLDMEKLLTDKVSNESLDKLELLFKTNMRSSANKLGLICLFSGFIIGLLQLWIVLLAK